MYLYHVLNTSIINPVFTTISINTLKHWDSLLIIFSTYGMSQPEFIRFIIKQDGHI